MQEEREYFVAYSDDDGTKIDGPFTKTELLDRITPGEDGTTWYGNIKFAARIPDRDGGCWMAPEGTTVVIKGRIVMPQPVQQIVKMEVD